jgi:hypothetical protein
MRPSSFSTNRVFRWRPGVLKASLTFGIVPMHMVHQVMYGRSQEKPCYGDHDESCIECVETREDFSWLRQIRIYGSHATEEMPHKSICQGRCLCS